MNYSTFQRRNHKKEKIIVICIMFFSVIMIGVFCYFLYMDIKSRPLIEYPRYTLSTTEWTSGNVTIEVQTEDGKISAYSFDGGKNYQESNSYEVLTNGDFYLVVKDINDRTSRILPISIRNIDKDVPVLVFENTTTIQLGSNFSLRNGVNVYDEGSGLNSNYVVTPDSIDTSVPGEYTVHYTAFDKVGNYIEKERKVIVSGVQGKMYYRYRDATIESYQCEPYVCNCVISSSASLNKTCPVGYTFNEPDKCCQTCYKTCKKTVWGEWSDWTITKVTPNAMREVETKTE